MLVDACRNDPTLGGGRPFTATEGTKQLARSLQEIKLPEGVVLMNSCAPNEISWEEQTFGHGVYMHYVLEGMAGSGDSNGDGHVSLNELQRYASSRTRSFVSEKFNQLQRPFSRSEGEAEAMDFALLRVGGDKPALPVARPALGVVPDYVRMDRGILVTDVTAGSAAERAGIRNGDVIVKIGGTATDDLEAFVAAMKIQQAGGTATIVVKRNDVDVPLIVTFGTAGINTATPNATTKNASSDNSITNGIGMKLMLIPAGEFLMGTNNTSYLTESEGPEHRVRITKPFYLGATEVTQGQWQAVMGTTPWFGKEKTKEGPDYPASYVSWNDSKEFCRKLSAREGKSYDLPTEAQWEYAHRAGTRSNFPFGDDQYKATEFAWCQDNTENVEESYPHQVGMKRPNPWGLFDMCGNVEEWCDDWYDAGFYATSRIDDPAGFTTGERRVSRGGFWGSDSFAFRSSSRGGGAPLPDDRESYRGFRVVLDP